MSTSTPDVCFNSAYYMQFKEENPEQLSKTDLVAIRPTFCPTLKSVEWATNSGNQERFFFETTSIDFTKYISSSEPPPLIVEQRSPKNIDIFYNHDNATLVRLTLDLFNRCVKPYVAGGSQLNFTSDEEVQAFFLTTSFNPYI